MSTLSDLTAKIKKYRFSLTDKTGEPIRKNDRPPDPSDFKMTPI